MKLSNQEYGAWAVFDSEDDFHTQRLIVGRGYPASPTLVCQVPAGTRRDSFMARAVLAAMGKGESAGSALTRVEPDWSYVRTWFSVLGIRRLVVLRAHALPPSVVETLMETAAVVEAEVVFVAVDNNVGRNLRDAFHSWAVAPMEMSHLLEAGWDVR